jgi:hypothetical protein
MRRGRGMCDGRRVRLRGFLCAAIVSSVVRGVVPGVVPGVVLGVGLGLGAAAPVEAAGDIAAGSAGDAAIDRARTQVLDGEYQAELPGHGSDAVPAEAAGLPRRRAGGELDAERERQARFDTRMHGEEGGSSLMRFVMWGLVIVIGFLTAMWLASELSRYGGDAELPLEAEAHDRMQAASAAIIDRPLGDADDLARRGEFAEAIHTLLLRTLQELARTASLRVGPATTSREILALVPLLADARTALAGLITAVEITHFGAEPAGDADYARCREQFHVFATAFRGRAGVLAA